MLEREIELMVRGLPDHLKIKILEYVKQLSKEQEKTPFRFSWKGGLSDLSEQYTSIELQHKALEWR